MIAYRLTIHDHDFERRFDVIGYYLHAQQAIDEAERRCAATHQALGGSWPYKRHPKDTIWVWEWRLGGDDIRQVRVTKRYGWDAYAICPIEIHV